MFFPQINLPAGAIAVLAGALTGLASGPASGAAQATPAVVESAPSSSTVERAFPTESCLANTVCEVKRRIRWRTPVWSNEFCQKISHAVLSASRKHDVHPSLILAVMLNESDMNESAFRVSERNGVVYAKDGGLMGIRCIVDKQGRCTNGNVRGLSWKQLMDPLTNIDIGARELSYWRTSGIVKATVRVRDANGRINVKEKYVPCKHKTHAYWAHYNHGPRYIDSGSPRHYPHRVAVLYFALARAMNLETPELAQPERITMRDPGRRLRTPDRPIEARYRKLCDQIRAAAGLCSGVASLPISGKKLN